MSGAQFYVGYMLFILFCFWLGVLRSQGVLP